MNNQGVKANHKHPSRERQVRFADPLTTEVPGRRQALPLEISREELADRWDQFTTRIILGATNDIRGTRPRRFYKRLSNAGTNPPLEVIHLVPQTERRDLFPNPKDLYSKLLLPSETLPQPEERSPGGSVIPMWKLWQGASLVLTHFSFSTSTTPKTLGEFRDSDQKDFYAINHSEIERSGTSWKVCCTGRTLPINMGFFIWNAIASSSDFSAASEMDKTAMSFLQAFCGRWVVRSWTRWCVVKAGSDWQQIHYHFRVLSPQSKDEASSVRHTGFTLQRERLRHRGRHIEYQERRVSFCVTFRVDPSYPCFTSYLITDVPELLSKNFLSQYVWQDVSRDMILPIGVPGGSWFQGFLYQLVNFWYQENLRILQSAEKEFWDGEAQDLCRGFIDEFQSTFESLKKDCLSWSYSSCRGDASDWELLSHHVDHYEKNLQTRIEHYGSQFSTA